MAQFCFSGLVLRFACLLLIGGPQHASGEERVASLPGYDGELPFEMYTGYITVNDTTSNNIFYYFIKSERNSTEDPLIFWLTGGPGCTGFSGLVFEIGPLKFKVEEYNGSLPTLEYNPYSFTKIASIIFIDSPTFTGFSYSNSTDDHITGNSKNFEEDYAFLKKWLGQHPEFQSNPLYIAGDSYAGMIIPALAYRIAKEMEDGTETIFNLKGYFEGNPTTDNNFDASAVPFVHGMSLIPKSLYQATKKSCNGQYYDPPNENCTKNLELVDELIADVNQPHILEVYCGYIWSPEKRARLASRKWKNNISDRRLPPGPWQLPIIGNLHQLGALPHRSFHLFSQKHGPLVFLKLGQIPTYVVSSAKLAREILKTHDAIFASRPQLAAFDALCYGCSVVAFQPHSEASRHMRKIFATYFSGWRRALSFKTVREEEVGLLVDAISHSAGLVNLSHLIRTLNNNIICRVALSKKFNEEADGAQKGRFHDIIETTNDLIEGFSVGDAFPSIKWVDWLTGFKFRLRRNFHELDRILYEVIRDHTDLKTPSTEKDFVDVLLEVQKDESQAIPLTTRRIKGLLLDVLLGGSVTSTSIAVWAMAELIRNPRVMKRVQDELRLKIKGKDKVEESDLDQLEFLKLVVKETLRMYPPGPMLIPRISMAECTNDGYTIPEKANIFVNAWTIGRDPNFWENPEEFQPERFINNPIDYKGQYFEFIPFGSGRRICPRIHLGVVVVELALANLLYCFNWSLPSGLSANDIDMSESLGPLAQLGFHPPSL